MSLLRDLARMRTCDAYRASRIAQQFKDVTRTLSISNVFNPSFYVDEQLKIFAFRAIPSGSNCLTSYVSIETPSERSIVNLSRDYCEELQVVRLIDPKVTKLGEDYYLTFNSGWIPGGNDLFVMKIHPRLERPKRVRYRHRKPQERNWAFFSEREDIYALYWINPLKILRLRAEDATSWEMEDFFQGRPEKGLSSQLTVGTPLTQIQGRYGFVAHKKHFFFQKKIYLGRFCLLDFHRKRIELGKDWLVHSYASLIGSRIKHNDNLLSCTYFSGIQALGDSLTLGYGINDVDYGFSKHRLGELASLPSSDIGPT